MAVPKYVPVITRVLQILFSIVCLGCSAYWASIFTGFFSLDPVNFGVFAGVTGLVVSLLLAVGPRFSDKLAQNLPGLLDCILSSLWCIFFLAVGASMASLGACSAGGAGMGSAMSAFSALGALDTLGETGSTYTSGLGTDDMLTFSSTTGFGNRHLLMAERLPIIKPDSSIHAAFENEARASKAMAAAEVLEAQAKSLNRAGAALIKSHHRRLTATGLGGLAMQAQIMCGTWDAIIAMGFINFVLYAVSAVLAGLDIKAGKGLLKPKGVELTAQQVQVASAAKPTPASNAG